MLLITQFLAELDLRVRSRETYHRALRQWASYLTAEGVAEPTATTVRVWRDWLLAGGKRAATVKLYLAAVRRYYQWCGSTIANTTRSVSVGDAHQRGSLTADEVVRLLDATPNVRDYALINLMVSTGLRPVQVSRVLVSGLAERGGQRVLHVQGKGRDDADDYVILTPRVWAPIATYMRLWQVEVGRPLFGLSVRRVAAVVHAALVRAGLWSPRISSYSLRHTAGTLALKGGATVVQVAAMLSHRQLRTTMIYLRDVERLTKPAESVLDTLLSAAGEERREPKRAVDADETASRVVQLDKHRRRGE